MNEVRMNIETRADTAEKAARAFGLDQPSALDAVKRSDYDTDEAYLNAATLYEMERSDPAYQQVRRRLKSELEARQEQAQRTEQAEAYKKIRAGTVLDAVDQRQIDAQAAERARADLAAGRIAASALGATIEKYANEMGEHMKDVKAGNQLFNGIIRGNR